MVVMNGLEDASVNAFFENLVLILQYEITLKTTRLLIMVVRT